MFSAFRHRPADNCANPFALRYLAAFALRNIATFLLLGGIVGWSGWKIREATQPITPLPPTPHPSLDGQAFRLDEWEIAETAGPFGADESSFFMLIINKKTSHSAYALYDVDQGGIRYIHDVGDDALETLLPMPERNSIAIFQDGIVAPPSLRLLPPMETPTDASENEVGIRMLLVRIDDGSEERRIKLNQCFELIDYDPSRDRLIGIYCPGKTMRSWSSVFCCYYGPGERASRSPARAL